MFANQAKEFETARELLGFFLHAILTARQSRPAEAGEDDGLYSGDWITIPSRGLLQSLHMQKVSFVTHNGDSGMHPALDPMLLAAKAAVVFLTWHNQRLAEGVEPQDANQTDLDELTAEGYLSWRETSIRPQNLFDFARGLGQPMSELRFSTYNNERAYIGLEC